MATDRFFSLEEAFFTLLGPEELRAFLSDLLTPAEWKSLQERWKVCQLLDSQQYSYRHIHEKTAASLATITRVARFLHQEDHQGYRLVLDRLHSSPAV